MPSFRTVRRVKHAPEQMFDLVADVDRYPEFLPLCTGLRVLRRGETGEGVEALVAEMGIGFKAIRETFTTKVTLDRPKLDIHVSYVDGPFRYLENHWGFRPDAAGGTGSASGADAAGGTGSAVEFAIDYEFRSMALGLLMGAMFDRAFRRFTSAFEERADDVYGRSRAKTGGTL